MNRGMSRRPVVSTMRSGVGELDDIDRRVAARIAGGRRALGLEPAVLDAVLAFREGTVERLERCRTRAAPSHLLRLADLFGVEIDWFFAEINASDDSMAGQVQAPHPAVTTGSREGEVEGAAEARRFLAAYSRLHDASVRAKIRAIVEAVAKSEPR
jgi:hypothetical protein